MIPMPRANNTLTLRLQPKEPRAGAAGFPAWIEGGDRLVPVVPAGATPRVRDGLVLRTVVKRRAGKRRTNDAGGR